MRPTDALRAAFPLRIALPVLAACALAATAPRPAAAQDTTAVGRSSASSDSLRTVTLTDGSRLVGRIVENGGDRVVVMTEAGVRVELDRSQIASIRVVGGGDAAKAGWADDPNGTRLFVGPTGRTLPAGQGYIGDFELFFPIAAYGITDRFTLAGGTIVVPEYTAQAFAVVPKFAVVRTPQASVSVGAAAFFATDQLDEGSAGFVFAAGTFGSSDNSITLGAMVPFVVSGGTSDFGHTAIVQIGAEARIGAHAKFITENYFLPGSGGLLSGGVRVFGERLSVDAGLGTTTEGGGPLPLLNFVYTLGGKKE
jgi:hypothetical protein